MSARVLLAVVSLVAGVMLAAWSLAAGQLLLALAGFALIFVFLYLAMEAMTKAGKPKQPLKPAANAAWQMKDSPPAASNDDGGEAPR